MAGEPAVSSPDVQAALIELVEELAARPELHDVLRLALRRMSSAFPFGRVSVVLLSPGEDVAHVVVESAEADLDNIVIRVSDYPELQQVMATRRPLVIPDVLGDALLSGMRAKIERSQSGHRSSSLFPLVRKGAVIGVLFLRSKELLPKISEELLAQGRLIASLTAVAIGNALEQDSLRREQRALLRTKARDEQAIAGLKQFEEFFERSHDGIVVTDRSGAIRYVNASAGSILAKDPQGLKGTRLVDLVAPRSRVLLERAFRGDAVGDAHGYVDLLVPRGESEAVISAALRTLTDPESVLVSFRDVTELREIENELRQTKDFLENLIQSSVDGIVAADIDGRIILFNRAAEQMLGYTAREVVGRMSLQDLYQPGEAAIVMRQLRGESFGGRGRLEPVRKDLRHKTGELIPVSLTAAIIYEDGREAATVGVFTDLRERVRMEEKLSVAQRKLQVSERQAVAIELAGVAAHELNQPLTSILGYAEMLRARIPADDKNRKPIDVICRETERMAGIVRKIGQLTQYKTQPYVGGAQILDLEQTDPRLIGKKER